MEKITTEFKLGDRVRIESAKDIAMGSVHFDKGDVTEVSRIAPMGIVVKSKKHDAELIIFPVEYEHITKLEASDDMAVDNAGNSILSEILAELKSINAKLDGHSKAPDEKAQNIYTAMVEADSIVPPKPVEPVKNAARIRSIKAAQSLISELSEFKSLAVGSKQGISHKHWIVRPHFNVDYDARTVTVELRGVNSGWVRDSATAKCHPEDTFNVTIGKAIALARALGRELPSALADGLGQPDESVPGAVERIIDDSNAKYPKGGDA